MSSGSVVETACREGTFREVHFIAFDDSFSDKKSPRDCWRSTKICARDRGDLQIADFFKRLSFNSFPLGLMVVEE
ncbi:MAG: hypothetical protein ACJAVK_001588 [Akkermansiaceae bacterium]|jgi:hypothetical protein